MNRCECGLQGYNDWTVETAPSVKSAIKSHSYIHNNFLNELNISKKETKDLNKLVLILDRNYHITTPNEAWNNSFLECTFLKLIFSI